MSKTTHPVHDWIIYWNDGQDGKMVKNIAVGAKKASHIKGTVLKGFRGTFHEVKAEVDRLNAQYNEMFSDTMRHYERSIKNDRRRKEAAGSVYSRK